MQLSNSRALFDEVMKLKVADSVQKIQIPVYVMQGKHDMQKHARRLVERLEAPVKRFYLFEKAGHSPFDDSKEEFFKVIDQILSEI